MVYLRKTVHDLEDGSGEDHERPKYGSYVLLVAT
jgi:hypothetical protein